MVTGLSTVATSGSFNDLDDKPAPFDPGTLATVATTGSYTDLSNKPTLPSTLSQLTDDTTHRLVTDTEKSTWNFKQNALSGDVTDHYHTADRYTHPANHPASMVTGLATVATTGNYLDLSGKPTIPTKTSDLTNDSGFVEISDGEFTPTLEGYSTAGSNTYSTQRGYYTRIGNFVHCDIYLALSAKGAMSGSVIINNLPFTSANQTNRNYSGSISIAQGIDYDSGYTWLGASMAPNSNYISLIIMGDNINASAPQSTAFTASSLIELSIDYVV